MCFKALAQNKDAGVFYDYEHEIVYRVFSIEVFLLWLYRFSD
jgi:hypothetical protein